MIKDGRVTKMETIIRIAAIDNVIAVIRAWISGWLSLGTALEILYWYLSLYKNTYVETSLNYLLHGSFTSWAYSIHLLTYQVNGPPQVNNLERYDHYVSATQLHSSAVAICITNKLEYWAIGISDGEFLNPWVPEYINFNLYYIIPWELVNKKWKNGH